MNKTLIAITLAALVSGCSSTKHISEMPAPEQHQAAKTRYYAELDQRPIRDDIQAEVAIETKFELASVKTAKRKGQ